MDTKQKLILLSFLGIVICTVMIGYWEKNVLKNLKPPPSPIDEKMYLDLKEKAEKWMPTLKKATKEEYIKWLRGYVAKGNTPKLYMESSFPSTGFYIATKDIEITPLWGAKAIKIIVPKDIIIIAESYGHNKIFWMANFRTNIDSDFVPIYSDTDIYENIIR